MLRKKEPNLPEISELEVMSHYLHLSQQTFGFDSGINVGMGTCTMKYSPKVNKQLAGSPKLADVHPLQDEETLQGMLEVMYTLTEYLKEITGMDAFSLQPAGGSHAAFTNCCIMRAYHKYNGELKQRNEIITPILSHPCNCAAPAMAGFKVITLDPDEETGSPDIEAVKAAVSKHTAGMLLTDPYDTGVFDNNIGEYAEILHDAGGLIILDQANANSILGITRAGDLGADLCHLNMHKSFSAPHGGYGPGSGTIGVKEEFEKFLPVPVIEFDGIKYKLNYNLPHSIGKTRSFYGVIPALLKSYAWIAALGAEGLKEVAEIAVINNNYLIKKLEDVPGLSLPYAEGHYRMQEARFSWEKLTQDTGVTMEDLNKRIGDFGVQYCFTSHHPLVFPEPMTPEPTESVSKADLDRFIDIIRQLSHEAYTNPELVKTAPHNAPISTIDLSPTYELSKFASTWRAYLKKRVNRSKS
jgi:glycine dehydrogenase subunit 2